MQTRFFADDGTEFKSAHECQAYERELHAKVMNEMSLDREMNEAVEVFEYACAQMKFSDEYLNSVGKLTRYTDKLPFVITYGVPYLRYDAVWALVGRMREPERNLKDMTC